MKRTCFYQDEYITVHVNQHYRQPTVSHEVGSDGDQTECKERSRDGTDTTGYSVWKTGQQMITKINVV